jgi:hypothetical protein
MKTLEAVSQKSWTEVELLPCLTIENVLAMV